MQAVAACLDVALLASPAGVEAFVALIGRKGAELCEFILGKEAAGDVLPVVDGADEFDVDAESAVRREGEEREGARVRHVEMDGRVAGCWRYRGFAAFGVVELDFVGRHREVLTEKLP